MQDQEFLFSFYSKVYEQGNTLTRKFLIAFSVIGIALSLIHQTWWIGLVGSGSCLLIYFMAANLGLSKAFMRFLVSFLYGNISLQFILQLHGNYTSFFTYFLCFTLLLFFENWKVLIPVTVHALVSTSVIFYLSYTGEPNELFASLPTFTTIEIVGHLVFIAGFSALCMYWAALQRNQTKGSAMEQWNSIQQLN